jgi:3-dehydroquinate synthase
MVYESMLAERLGLAKSDTTERVRSAVRATGLPDARPHAMPIDAVIEATRSDKKARAGHAEFALPARIGAMAAAEHGWSIPVSEDLVREILA